VTTDVLIVGSGFGAAAPALRLSRAGLRVLVVEKGPHLDPDRDFRQTQDPHYVRRYLKSLPGDRLNVTYAEALGGGSGFYEMVSLRAPSIAFVRIEDQVV
jgi:choline dehydrogenase-like flavoprotein